MKKIIMLVALVIVQVSFGQEEDEICNTPQE